MKKGDGKTLDDMRAEYDFAAMKGGVRGKYAGRYRRGTNLILLEPDLVRAFPNGAVVNQTLRAILEITDAIGRKTMRSADRDQRRGKAERQR